GHDMSGHHHETSNLLPKVILAGLTGALLMIMTLDPVMQELKRHSEVQTILTAEFLLTLPVLLWCGWQFYAIAFRLLRHRSADMNTLIAMGTAAAFIYSTVATFWTAPFASAHLAHDHMLGDRPPVYFDSAVVITALILFGRWL